MSRTSTWRISSQSAKVEAIDGVCEVIVSNGSSNITNTLGSHSGSDLPGAWEAEDGVCAACIIGAMDFLGQRVIVVHVPCHSGDSNTCERDVLCTCVVIV